MSRAVLNGARQWTVNEVRDPHFYENQSAFTDYNSLNSGDHDSDRFRQEAIDPEFRMVVPEFLKLNSSRIRIQEWFDGETLVRMKPSQKTDVQANQISVEDAKSVSKMLVANFFHQLLETGVVHSNFHPGQFMVSNEKRIAILDTKNILRFSESERHAIIDAGIKVFMGDKKGAVTDLLTEICGPRENIDKVASDILEKISKVSSADLPEYVTAILGTLYENGIELDNKWMLLGQNLLGLRRTLMKLGYSAGSIGLLGDGMSLDQVATVLPKTFAYIQLKLQ
jgi:predicted unusual protein kinase regulating ubiquinone biosynthesis (AarF/ABC1/UbiB family)